MAIKEAIALIFFAFFLRGIYDFLTNYDANKCQMTYMFEYPEYVSVPMRRDVSKRFPKYRLYVYGEGLYANQLHAGKLSGIPVLFIHGNAGSYKQSRSIGSVLLRMAESINSDYHFDVFTVDFNEELSALYGVILNKQTEFVGECIKHILLLYKQNRLERQQVILYGHSMGGIIARALFTLPDFNHRTVDIIFNFATPNIAPVFAGDKYLTEFYDKVNLHWKYNYSLDNGGIDHVDVVSIAGGDHDILVRSDLTRIDRPHDIPSNTLITTIASAVPTCWVSTDHLCILWCRQLVLVTARTLFDITKYKKITRQMKHKILSYHFIRKTSSAKHFPSELPPTVFEFSPNGFWRERNDKTWVFFRRMVVKHSHILVPLIKDGEMIVITGFNIPKNDWIFACRAVIDADGKTKMCTEAENLSDKTEMLVSNEKTTRRRVQLSVNELKTANYTHVMTYSGLANSKVEIIGERYIATRRHINFQVSGGWDFIFAPQTVLYSTAPKATFYNISLVGLRSLWQAFIIKIDSQSCPAVCSEFSRGLVQMHTPWSNDLKQANLRCNDSTELVAKLVVPMPVNTGNADSQIASLLLHLDPDCSYRVTIQVSFREVMSQFVRFYGTMLPAYVIAHLLLGLSAQLQKLSVPGPCPDFLSSLSSCSALNLVAIPSLLVLLLQSPAFVAVSNALPIPPPDDDFLNAYALSFAALRPLIFLVSYGFVIISSWLLHLVVVFWSNCIGWIKSSNMMLIGVTDPLTRIKRKWDVSMPTEKQLYHLSYFPLLSSCMIVGIGYVTCGTFVLIVITFLMFSMLCNMCCDNRVLADRKGQHRFSTRWHLYFTLLQLWMWLTVLNVPSLLQWIKNLDLTVRLDDDPALLTTALSVVSLVAYWQYGVPTEHSSTYFLSALISYLSSIVVTVYCLVSPYRIQYVISAVLLAVALQQIATIILHRNSGSKKQN